MHFVPFGVNNFWIVARGGAATPNVSAAARHESEKHSSAAAWQNYKEATRYNHFYIECKLLLKKL